MRAAFDDPPRIEHQHQIGMPNRAQPVGHDETRATLEQLGQRL